MTKNKGGAPLGNQNRLIGGQRATPQTYKMLPNDLDNIDTIAEFFDTTKVGAIRKALQLLADEISREAKG